MRSFVAVDLAPELRRPLVRLLQELPRVRDVRWCTQDQLHVTLKFLGEVDQGRLKQVCEIVAQTSAQIEPFQIRLAGLGGFPSRRSPRVLWCGVEDPTGSCARWVALSEPQFTALGFEAETRDFTPHITLGRSKSPAGAAAMREVLERTAALPTVEMTVKDIVLFESRLSPAGARYIRVQTSPLGT
ncbi:MAG: RNA 2',3'-cyclic phosphodiesterase [Phycisphaerae bacterium]|nr:RNA 2',3'-cyclic phosphodiesterase [Phycisphaerae bacterium]